MAIRPDAAQHAEELEAAHVQLGEELSHRRQVARLQRAFVGRAIFAGVRQKSPRESQQRIATPRLAEHRHAARFQHAMQFRTGDRPIEVMQDGIPPNRIERRIGER